MAGSSAHFEAVLRSEGEVLREQTTCGRARTGLAVGCGLLLAAAAAFAFTGSNKQAIQFLKGTDTISKEDQLQKMIDDNNAEITNLKKELPGYLASKDFGNFALVANTLQMLMNQNARNEDLRQKVIKAGDDLLGGEYGVVDTSLDDIIADKCNATTMTDIAHLKIKAKNATDQEDFDSIKKYIDQVTELFPRCQNPSVTDAPADAASTTDA